MKEIVKAHQFMIEMRSLIETDEQKFMDDLEAFLGTFAQPTLEETNHYFGDGQYFRSSVIPGNLIMTGARHRYKSVNILAKGKMSVYNGKDSPVLYLEAPAVWVSEAGVKKIAITYEEVVWMNAFPTSETDIDKIAAEMYINNKGIK